MNNIPKSLENAKTTIFKEESGEDLQRDEKTVQNGAGTCQRARFDGDYRHFVYCHWSDA
jgi:hypothetical protein